MAPMLLVLRWGCLAPLFLCKASRISNAESECIFMLSIVTPTKMVKFHAPESGVQVQGHEYVGSCSENFTPNHLAHKLNA